MRTRSRIHFFRVGIPRSGKNAVSAKGLKRIFRLSKIQPPPLHTHFTGNLTTGSRDRSAHSTNSSQQQRQVQIETSCGTSGNTAGNILSPFSPLPLAEARIRKNRKLAQRTEDELVSGGRTWLWTISRDILLQIPLLFLQWMQNGNIYLVCDRKLGKKLLEKTQLIISLKYSISKIFYSLWYPQMLAPYSIN